MPVGVRSTSLASIWLRMASSALGARPLAPLLSRFLPVLGVSTTLSTRLFQALQCGHLPSQRGVVPPHSLHA
jgi:hypothetical protein